MSNVWKFNRLLKVVEGPAKTAVAQFVVDEQNYEEAYELLKSRYGDKTKLEMELYRALKATIAPNETVEDQRRYADQIGSIYSQLKAIRANTDNIMVTQEIISKLPPRTRDEIADSVDFNGIHSIKTFLEALNRVVNRLDISNFTREMSSSSGRNSSHLQSMSGPMTQTRRPPRPPLNDGLCVFCKQADHRCWECTVHSSRASREAVLRHEHRCFNCLEPGHMTPTCTRGNCRHCNGKHHFSICGRATTGSTNRRLSGNQAQTNRQNSRNAGPIASGENQEPLRSSSLCTSVAVPVNEDPKQVKLGRILTATVMAFNEDRKLFEEISVVLDTASDTSYIESPQ
ncbi:hypothetical protein L596_029695 [Steinernema carpocapsae]|uniref:CCHC-type domain-containing protein n=1 Tax=Steinernema carpocapsae TaxID=34508 RepID=A0A4U5LQI8_STECR|nr:hypothetical protein L596_029695 [Steinernema carpocapsae]